MCGPLLMLASHYTDTRFMTMARTGGLSWYRLGIWPCTRYGGRDRGESGEKYHSHGIPCQQVGVPRLIVAPKATPVPLSILEQKIVNKPVFHRMTLVTTACWLVEPSRNCMLFSIIML